jgi:hypothetical protein
MHASSKMALLLRGLCYGGLYSWWFEAGCSNSRRSKSARSFSSCLIVVYCFILDLEKLVPKLSTVRTHDGASVWMSSCNGRHVRAQMTNGRLVIFV